MITEIRSNLIVSMAIVSISLVSCSALAEPMPPSLSRNSAALWDSTDGFTSVRNQTGVASTSLVADPNVGTVYRMTYSGNGQNYFGGYVDSTTMRNAIADFGQLNVRYLIRFGTQPGQPEWESANRTVLGNVWGYELKAFDVHNGNTSQRIIMMIKPAWGSAGNTSRSGTLVLRIDGANGERQLTVPERNGLNSVFNQSGVWYYCEVEIREDGAVRYWFAPHTGTGAEYTEGSPTVNMPNSHSFNFDWIRSSVFDFGFRNHAVSGTKQIDARLTISNSFIGPGDPAQ